MLNLFISFFFKFSYWHKASDDMNSHVSRSRAAKKASQQQQSTGSTSVFSRLSTAMFGSRAEPSASAEQSATGAKSKRSFGFATRNLQWQTDKTSEDLYRYKNMPVDFASSAPAPNDEREDKPSAAVPKETTQPFAIQPKQKNDSDSDDDY